MFFHHHFPEINKFIFITKFSFSRYIRIVVYDYVTHKTRTNNVYYKVYTDHYNFSNDRRRVLEFFL